MSEAAMFAKRMLLVSIGLVCLSQLPSTAAAQAFITAWGAVEPQGVAVGGSGNVYVSDQGDHSVKVFTSTGELLGQWTVPPCPFPEGGPWNIAVDSNDNVYVTTVTDCPELFTTKVLKFTSTGTLVAEWISAGNLAVDALGNVYVSDRANSRIQVFTSSGAYLREWGTAQRPDGLAIDASGYVYVACTEGGGNPPQRVQKYSNDGTFLTEWGSGAGDGQFYPVRVAVSLDGRVYVTDFSNHRVQVFTSDGAFVTMWGSPGSASGQFDYPLGIAVDASGYIYVVDKNNTRIQKFGPAPTPVQSVTWGSMKARYRGAPGAAQTTTQDR